MNYFIKQKNATTKDFTTKIAQPLTQAAFAIIGTNISAFSVDKNSFRNRITEMQNGEQ